VAAELDNVITEVPLPAIGFVAKDALIPDGKPLALNVTESVKPPSAAIVTVAFAELPAFNVAVAGLLTEKSLATTSVTVGACFTFEFGPVPTMVRG